MPARQQLGNPAARTARGDQLLPGRSALGHPCWPRPTFGAAEPGPSRWSQMESHQEHTGTRTSPCPRCPCLAGTPRKEGEGCRGCLLGSPHSIYPTK